MTEEDSVEMTEEDSVEMTEEGYYKVAYFLPY